MSDDKYNELLALVRRKMPSLQAAGDGLQYTGKGWMSADPARAEAALHELQQELAVRQAEITADGGE